MAIFQIKHRFTGAVLFELECGSLKLAVEAAVGRRANLRGANLDGANLRGAYLRGANLRGANLGGAYLRGHKVDGSVGLILAGMPNNWDAFGFVDADSGALRVRIGCKHKEIGAGREYWSSPEHHDLENRREVLAALDYIEAVARLRGWAGATSNKGAA